MTRFRWSGGRRVASLAALFDGREDAPAAPTRGSRALIAGALLLSAIPLSGVPRYLAGLSLGAGLGIVLVLDAAFLAVVWPLLGVTPRSRTTPCAFLVLAVVSSALALALFAAPALEGFPAGTCADAGNHILFKNRFVASDPKIYQGMFGLYALVHWLNKLGLDDIGAFRLGFQLDVVACLLLTSAVVVVGVGSSPNRWIERSLYLATTVATSVSAFFVTLPLLQYYQSDGYLAQLHALVPLTVALGAYAFASRRLVRVLALVLSIVLYRFTYLLNAGELLLACSLMLLAEWRQAPRVRPVRATLLALALGCGAASVVAYLGLRSIIPIAGGFRSAPLGPQMVGTGLLSVVFAVVGPACRYFGVGLAPSSERLARFMAVLAGGPTLLVSGWLLSGHQPVYYIEKYAFCAIVLGSLCVVPLVLPAACRLVSRGGTPAAGVVASALVMGTCGGLFGLAWSADTYRLWFHDSLSGPPYALLEPHADRSVWRFISSTLQKQHAIFGGFLTPRWPESQFTNAHFIGGATLPANAAATVADDNWTIGKYNALFEGEAVESAGHCVFWYENRRLPKFLQARWPKAAKATVDRLQALRPRSCHVFTPKDAPTRRFAVCEVCFGEQHQSRPLSFAGNLEGFHGVEKDTDGSEVRWTMGNGKVAFTLTDAEATLSCGVKVGTIGDLPFELWVDGARLGIGPRQQLPKLSARAQHVLEIRSPSFVPANTGASADGRVLGVRVARISLECSDDPAPAGSDDREPGAINIVSATYGLACGAAQGNYTQSVADECNGRIDCSYPPGERRGDPFPGCAKDFSVQYRCGAQNTVRQADHPPDQDDHYTVPLNCD